ncbi:MuDR family transposase [Melia azedarach]|uniref:MuDR family transposase n=1 Tax=Melia azedarach TaxID=155640 RepID=A0ACC1XCX7_MELAZ|nr:MuDR family transposase [Melia azedarach]
MFDNYELDDIDVIQTSSEQCKALEFYVTPTKEDHLPKMNREEAEQAANYRLFASDSEDELPQQGDDDEDIVMEDYGSGNDSDVLSDKDLDSTPTSRYERNNEGFEYTMDSNGKIEMKKGHTFYTVYDFRKMLQVFVVRNGFKLKRLKNEKARVTCKCATEKCSWRIHASPTWNRLSFQIKTYNPTHTCKRVFDNWEATSSWIAAQFIDLFKANPEIDLKICGCHNENHPGNVVDLQTEWLPGEQNPRFKRFFLSFDAQRRGFFQDCRPFVGLDGCHLRGLYKRVLLTAVSIDANYGIYPLAFGVVETENQFSWRYFLEKLYQQFGKNRGIGLCFMSDRQKGVLNALEQHFPNSDKRFCCRHIYANFKYKFPGAALKSLFWQAARSGSMADFNKHMEKIKTISESAHSWLTKIPISNWSMHRFSKMIKSAHVTNNMSETYNSWINQFRGLPILRLCEEIRIKTMQLIHNRYIQAKKWDGIIPLAVKRRIVDLRERGRDMNVVFGDGNLYEVLVDNQDGHVVDLGTRECDCGMWQITGLPCMHALCCIDTIREEVEKYMHPYLLRDNYLRTYKEHIQHMPSEIRWPLLFRINEIGAPKIKRQTGRPKKARKREPSEEDKVKRSCSVRCKVCNEWGHNKRTCGKIAKKKVKTNKGTLKVAHKLGYGDVACSNTQETGRIDLVSGQLSQV